MTPQILTEGECLEERTPEKLYNWVFEKIDLFYLCTHRDLCLRRQLLLHKGLFKQFYEEMYLLAFFVKRCYGGRTDVWVRWITGSQPYDAIISDKTGQQVFVEITQACYDYDQVLKMEHYLHQDRQGLASLTGKAVRDDTQRTRIRIDDDFTEDGDEQEEDRRLIAKTLDRKARKLQGHYRPSTILVVAVDDYVRFVTRQDWVHLKEVAIEKISSEVWPFAGTFFVGVSGRSFCAFVGENMPLPLSDVPKSYWRDWAKS